MVILLRFQTRLVVSGGNPLIVPAVPKKTLCIAEENFLCWPKAQIAAKMLREQFDSAKFSRSC